MTNIIVNPAGFKAKQNALSFGKQGKRITSGGGVSTPIDALDNVLLWIDGSDTSRISTSGGNVTQVVSKDPEERVLTKGGSGNITLGDKRINFPGNAGLSYSFTDGDPIREIVNRQLVFSVMVRARNNLNASRPLIDTGVAGSAAHNGFSIYGNQLRFYGTGNITVTWVNLDNGTITDNWRDVDPADTFKNLLVASDGSTANVFLGTQNDEKAGLTPDGSGNDEGLLTIGTAPTNLSFGWTGEIYQLVVTSDVITPEEYALFRLWEP